MLKASHAKISLSSLETRKFSFFSLLSLSNCSQACCFFLCQLLRAGVAARSAGPGMIPLRGQKKSLVTHPLPSSNAANKPAPDSETGGRRPLLRSPNSPVLMEKVPSENLLSQNFNGLAKRHHLPSGGSIIRRIVASVALVTLSLEKKPVFPPLHHQIYADIETYIRFSLNTKTIALYADDDVMFWMGGLFAELGSWSGSHLDSTSD